MSRKKTAKRTRRASSAKRTAASKPAGRTSRARTTVKRAATKRTTAKKRATTVRSASRRLAGTRTTATRKGSKKTARPRLRLVPSPAGKGGKTVRSVRRAMPKLRAVKGGTTAAREAAGEPATKQQVLFDLMRARAQVLSVLHNLSAADAERPIAKGKWCVREIVAHLALRDRARLRELESSLRGVPCSWTGFTLKDWKRSNAEEMKSAAHLNWPASLELLRSTREELIEALESVPDEPAEVWGESHAFGAMLGGLPQHDLHHGAQLKAWREEQGL